MSKNRSDQFHDDRASVASFAMFRAKTVWVLVVLLGLIVTGCKSSTVADPLVDHSFLTQQPCSAPCWYSLELERSSKRDVYDVLNQLSFIDSSSIKEVGTSWLGDDTAKEILFGCTHPQVKSCGGVLISQDKLKRLWFIVGYELTFQATVDQLGPPDYVDYGPYHPEVGGCIIDLNWPEKGIVVENMDTRSDAQCQNVKQGKSFSPEIGVTAIFYSVKEGFGTHPGGCCTRISWPGFTKP